MFGKICNIYNILYVFVCISYIIYNNYLVDRIIIIVLVINKCMTCAGCD